MDTAPRVPGFAGASAPEEPSPRGGVPARAGSGLAVARGGLRLAAGRGGSCRGRDDRRSGTNGRPCRHLGAGPARPQTCRVAGRFDGASTGAKRASARGVPVAKPPRPQGRRRSKSVVQTRHLGVGDARRAESSVAERSGRQAPPLTSWLRPCGVLRTKRTRSNDWPAATRSQADRHLGVGAAGCADQQPPYRSRDLPL